MMNTTCVDCDEAITNPLCPGCLSAKMRIIVKEHDPTLAEEITGMNLDGETTCISCGQHMGLCAHCFTKDTYEFVRERNPAAALDLLNKFDFELRHDLRDFA